MSSTGDTAGNVTDDAETVRFGSAVRLWAKIGLLSFGGPAGQIALMHRELVERRRWISESRFLHALNYCMLLPGPEAQQLATYIGWLLHRTRGGIVAGTLFVLPGFVAMMALSWLYVRFQNLTATTALLFGLKAAVLAIVVEAVLRIGRRALHGRLMLSLAVGAFVAIFFFKIAFPWIVGGAALIGLIFRDRVTSSIRPTADSAETSDRLYLLDRLHASGKLGHTIPSTPRAFKVVAICLLLWSAPLVVVFAWVGSQHVLAREGVIFSQTALITFGGAYAALSYIAQRAVENLHWLRPGEMVDALGLAETTPGPLILVLQFVGFLAAYRFAAPLDPWLAAVLGATLTTWVTFVPCFLFIFLGGPYIESLRSHRGLQAALSSITAAIVGVILNLSVWFALHTLFRETVPTTHGPIRIDLPVWSTLEPGAFVLGAAACIAMLRFRVGMGWTLTSSTLLGAIYWWWRYV